MVRFFSLSFPTYNSRSFIYYYMIGYVEELFTELWKVLQDGSNVKVKRISTPPPLCTSLEKPDKDEAVTQHKSRFSKQS